MNPDDDTLPYVPPMHLGRTVGSASSVSSVRSSEPDPERLAEIDRRITELEAEALTTGISGKLRIEQSLEELRREKDEALGKKKNKSDTEDVE